jgi:hypothetical protein
MHARTSLTLLDTPRSPRASPVLRARLAEAYTVQSTSRHTSAIAPIIRQIAVPT